MADVTIKTRSKQLTGTITDWQAIENSFIPKHGEICVVEIPTGGAFEQTTPPAVVIKVGDGKTVFKSLPYLSAFAADVHAWAKKGSLEYDDLPETLRTEIDNLQSAVGDGGSVAESIANAINALDVTDTAQTGQFVTAVAQEDGKVVVSRSTIAITDVVGLRNELDTIIGSVATEKQRAEAAEKANADAIAAIKDSDQFASFSEVASAIVSNTMSLEEKINKKADAATTLEGYGITDAYTKDEVDEKVDGTIETVAKLDGDENTEGSVKNLIKPVSDKVDTLIGTDAGKSARTIANEELAAQLVPESAKESLDTLAEIAAWIQSHPDDASAMNEAITALQNQVKGIDAGEGTVKKYIDDAIAALRIGDYALAADLTALAGRVTTLEGRADALDLVKHFHMNAGILDTIDDTVATSWGTAVQYVSAAGTGLKVEKTGTQVVLSLDPDTVFILDGGSATDLV